MKCENYGVYSIKTSLVKIFHKERRDYESVDKKSVSQALSRKTTKERIIQAVMGQRK